MHEGTTPELLQAIRTAGGQFVTVGSKQWVHFDGPDAEQRAQMVIATFVEQFSFRPSFASPGEDDDDYDYAIRMD